MSAFDRLQGYSAKRGLNESSEVFDVMKPEGAFLNRIHQEGYSMYKIEYRLKPEYEISDESYNTLSDEDKEIYDSRLLLSESDWLNLGVEDKNRYERKIVFSELHDVLTTSGNQIINAIAGSGKALVNGTKVRAEHGYVVIENLKVGDNVYGTDGQLHKVIGVYPQGKKKVYEVEFSSGVVIPCSGDHLWEVYWRDDDFGDETSDVLRTETIAEMQLW